jgi:hypothetical protein
MDAVRVPPVNSVRRGLSMLHPQNSSTASTSIASARRSTGAG